MNWGGVILKHRKRLGAAGPAGAMPHNLPRGKELTEGMTREHARQSVIQNLEDAGCDAGTVERFLSLMEGGRTEAQLELLSAQRRRLLDRVHREERRIDCLDYLVYQIQKGRTEG